MASQGSISSNGSDRSVDELPDWAERESVEEQEKPSNSPKTMKDNMN
tara:strand:- start:456 stop:596 length:141 start_codon:yes stop_codon:yes gene_type:complete